MRLCPVCFKNNIDKNLNCMQCNAPLGHITDKENKENIWKYQQKKRLKGHLITGVLAWWACLTFFGLLHSLLPIPLLINLVYSIVFGLPLGFLISKYAQSIWGGMLIGIALGILYCFVLFLINYGATNVSYVTIVFGIISGAFPGALMGWHVSMDDG